MFSAKEIRGRDKTLRRDREGHTHWPAAAEKLNVEDTPRLPAVSAGAHWHGLRKPNLHNKNKRPSSPSRQKLLHGEDRAGVMHLPHAYSSASQQQVFSDTLWHLNEHATHWRSGAKPRRARLALRGAGLRARSRGPDSGLPLEGPSQLPWLQRASRSGYMSKCRGSQTGRREEWTGLRTGLGSGTKPRCLRSRTSRLLSRPQQWKAHPCLG